MLSIAARVRRTINRFTLLPPGSRVLAALSGGPDSIVLTHVLAEIAASCGFELAGVAHLHHGLREAADEDERFCRRVAEALAVPIVVHRVDAAAEARARGESIEEAGRRLRYEFLGRAAVELDAGRIAVGHTRDDQAETFLLRLVRGAGPRGLAGIHPRVGRVVRPLVEVSRADVRRYLDERGLACREDPSNQDLGFARNRVRHVLLPLLEREFSPRVSEALARAATIAREDSALLDELALRAAHRIADRVHGRVRLDVAALAAEPPAVARRVARLALEAAAPGRFIGFDAASRLLDLAAGRTRGTSLQLPGVLVRRDGGGPQLVLEAAPGRNQEFGANSFQYLLSIPGEVISPERGWTVTAECHAVPPGGILDQRGRLRPEPDSCWVDAALVPGGAVVRAWQPGDRLRPLGAPGRRKLQDLFVDRKVPRSERASIPVVTDRSGRIVWVAGLALAEDFRVTASTRAVVILKLKHWRNRA